MSKIPVYVKLDNDNRPDKLGAYTSVEPIAPAYGGTGTNDFSGSVNQLAATQASSIVQNYIDVCSLAGGGGTTPGQVSSIVENYITVSGLTTSSQTSAIVQNYIDVCSLDSGGGVTDHGALTGLNDNDHPQYVLVTTNTDLSTLVINNDTILQDGLTDLNDTIFELNAHVASAVHWQLSTLNNNYINASGDSSNNAFYFSSLSSTTMSATNYSGVSLSGSLRDVSVDSPITGQVLTWNGTTWENDTSPVGVTDHGLLTGLGDNDHPQYTLSATNLALSTLVSNIETSTVDISAYINANESSWIAGGGGTTSAQVSSIVENYIGVCSLDITDHGELTGLSDNDHPQYVLVTTNTALSTLVDNIETSTIDLSAYIAANETAWATDTNTTDHGALTGLNDNDHPQYVLVTTNTNLSSTVTDHLTSAVHWDINTLNTNYINASGDSSNNAFYFSSLSATTMSATNYSGISLSGSLNDTNITSPALNTVLAWNGTKWQSSAISFPGGGGGLTQEQVEQIVLNSIASGITTSAISVSGNGTVSSTSSTNVFFSANKIYVSSLPYPAPYIFLQLSADASARTLSEFNWLSGATPQITNLDSDHFTYVQSGDDERYVTVNVPGVYEIKFYSTIDCSALTINQMNYIIKVAGSPVLSVSAQINQAADPAGITAQYLATLTEAANITAFYDNNHSTLNNFIRTKGSFLSIERRK